MTPQVKICGLTRAQDVELAIRYGADYLGFIIEAPSKRRLSIAQAAKIAHPAKGSAQTVAVTVNASDVMLAEITQLMQPDYIQFHGDETPERIAEIARKHGVKTIKAMPVASAADMKLAETYSGIADIILYDAKPPKGESVRGGHGLSFDWTLLTQNPLPKFWALAGGLAPKNIAEAMQRTHAPMLDVSSGVERSPGLKDHTKIREFIRQLRP